MRCSEQRISAPLSEDRRIDFSPGPREIVAGSTTEEPSEDPVALSVAAEIRAERRVAQRLPAVDQLDEFDEAKPCAVLRKRHAQVATEKAAQLSRIRSQSIRDPLLRPGSFDAQHLERAATQHVSAGEIGRHRREDAGELSFHRHPIAHSSHGRDPLFQGALLGGIESNSRARRTNREVAQPFYEAWLEGHDVELEIGAGLEQLVILTRLKEHHIATRHGDGPIADAERRCAPEHEVELRLFVKMAGTMEARLVSPSLGSTPRQHGEGLKQGFRAGPHENKFITRADCSLGKR